jgi:hypothetical protein
LLPVDQGETTMRTARKLTLLAMLAIAATALAAPSAFAQTEPELHNQAPRIIAQQELHNANDVNCPVVSNTPPPAVSPNPVSGGCRLHFNSIGTVPLSAHLSAGGPEVAISDCTVEFDIRIDAAGEGWISHQEFTGPNPPCTRQACGQANPPTGEGRAYSFHMNEVEPPARTEFAEVLFCVEPIGQTAPSHCEVRVPMTQPTSHRYHFVAQDTPGHGAFPHCELTGTFEVEAAGGLSGENQVYQNVEIRHN